MLNDKEMKENIEKNAESYREKETGRLVKKYAQGRSKTGLVLWKYEEEVGNKAGFHTTPKPEFFDRFEKEEN